MSQSSEPDTHRETHDMMTMDGRIRRFDVATGEVVREGSFSLPYLHHGGQKAFLIAWDDAAHPDELDIRYTL